MADGRLRRAKLAFERNFTQVPNEWLRDPNLSLKARGLLAMLMTHDEGYIVTHKQLSEQGPDGRTIIESAVKELKEQGYLDILSSRGRGGKIEGWVWELTDPVEVKKRRSEPLPGFPDYGKPVTRLNRNTENPHLKEQHLKEHLTKELNADSSTGAGTNEDASGDSLRGATESVEDSFKRSLHARCEFFSRGSRECDWAPSGYCQNCGRPLPSILPTIEEARS